MIEALRKIKEEVGALSTQLGRAVSIGVSSHGSGYELYIAKGDRLWTPDGEPLSKRQYNDFGSPEDLRSFINRAKTSVVSPDVLIAAKRRKRNELLSEANQLEIEIVELGGE